MSQEKRPLITRAGAATDVILALVVFVIFWQFIIPSHVPFYDPIAVSLVSAYAATVMAGFSWMALSLFRVTRVDQKLRKQEQKAAAANGDKA